VWLIILLSEMSKGEIKDFLLQGTFTGKLGTINKDGTPHVVPIWYTVDGEDNIIFNTSDKSVKQQILDVTIVSVYVLMIRLLFSRLLLLMV
jgi:nitroimidazol reductase NimA-like FMN-containing flavoprotein (pyridoxamine 5'-phosphate oxidase superfamily)